MQFLIVINKVLDLKIVQYTLLISVITLTVFSSVQTVKLKYSQKTAKSALQERDLAKAAVTIQNNSIEALRQAGESRAKDMKVAVASAETLAANWKVRAQGLEKKLGELSKTDCQSAVDDFIELIPEITGEGGTQ
jgi:hypothetical protein